MPLSWSDWHGVSDWKEAPNTFGVYRIRLAQSGKPFSIPRFLGEDPEGILWIGHATNLRSRLRIAYGALQGGNHPHSEAKLLYALEQSTDLKNRYERSEYQYSFALLGSKTEAEDYEVILIQEYIKQYGEAPPLNSAIPGGQLLRS